MAKFCLQCGAQLRESAAFCNVCGAAVRHNPQNDQSVQQDPNVHIDQVPEPVCENNTCSKCGAILRPGAKFCLTCGNIVEAEPRMFNEQSQHHFRPQIQQAMPKERKKSSLVKYLGIGAAACAGLAVIGLIIGILGATGSGKDTGTQAKAKITEEMQQNYNVNQTGEGQMLTSTESYDVGALLDYAKRLEDAGCEEAAQRVYQMLPDGGKAYSRIEADQAARQFSNDNGELKILEMQQFAVDPFWMK